MTTLRAFVGRANAEAVLGRNESHSFGLLVLIYTFNLYEQVEKELETVRTAGKIRTFDLDAGVAQLVEHFLAKEDVASSSLVTRFHPLVPRGLQRGRLPFHSARCGVPYPKGESVAPKQRATRAEADW
jgi:hypothetical protein